jgi:hypothetical protein
VEKHIRKNIIRIRVSPICKLIGTPDQGAPAPQIPVLAALCPQLNLLNPAKKIFLSTSLIQLHHSVQLQMCLMEGPDFALGDGQCSICTAKLSYPQGVLAMHWDAGAVSSKPGMGNHREEEEKLLPITSKKVNNLIT